MQVHKETNKILNKTEQITIEYRKRECNENFLFVH